MTGWLCIVSATIPPPFFVIKCLTFSFLCLRLQPFLRRISPFDKLAPLRALFTSDGGPHCKHVPFIVLFCCLHVLSRRDRLIPLPFLRAGQAPASWQGKASESQIGIRETAVSSMDRPANRRFLGGKGTGRGCRASKRVKQSVHYDAVHRRCI